MPFSVEEFFTVFARYNQAIWPLQILAYLAGLGVLALVVRRARWSSVGIALVLASMWAVNGIGYHWAFFAEVNPAARLFAVIFVLQAALLLAAPWLFPDLAFAVRRDARTLIGLAMMAFAALVYPVWGALAGHAYPAAPVFGVAPCPTTIFTIGVLLLGSWSAVRWLLIIPGIWSAVGGSAALLLRVPQDFGLLATLLVTLGIALGHWRGFGFARHERQH